MWLVQFVHPPLSLTPASPRVEQPVTTRYCLAKLEVFEVQS